MFASSALAVLTIVSPDMRMWANLPVTMQHLGVMLSVFPASMLMMRRGRKFGFRIGSVMGMVGASCAALGLRLGSFPVMCLGGLLLGYAIANMQLYRFAAVELAPGRVPRPGDLLCDGGRRDRRHRRPDPGALDARSLAADCSRRASSRVIVIHAIVFIVLGFIEFPVVKAEDSSRPAAAAARDRHPARLHGRRRRAR